MSITGGPWVVSQINGIILDREGLVVAFASYTEKLEEEVKANTRLIAAAPCMLAALEMIMSGVRAKEVVEAVRAAITKAKGDIK